MRPLPQDPATDLSTQRRADGSQEVEITLISRLFGGGARTRKLDERAWLRSAALKSALRFWWRAGQAHRFPDLATLRGEEARLFGEAARFGPKGAIQGGPGLLSVEVPDAQLQGLGQESYEPVEGEAVNIAYFSAAEQKRKGIDAAKLGVPQKGTKAKLVLHLPVEASEADREQILDALRLWLVLGGVGSRTRRGAGAVAVTKEAAAAALGVPTSLAELKAFLRRWLHPPSDELHQHPGLWALAQAQAVLLGRGEGSAEAAHERLLAVLREVRQDRPHPREWKGPKDWGQSRWPEGDALRLRVGVKPGAKHPPRSTNAERYPRATLGLPIVVHFKDEGAGGDPADHSISAALPSGGGWLRLNRFASPLLLRPVQVWEEGQPRFVPVAWVGPYTLPSDARPLVEPTAGGVPSTVPAKAIATTFDLAAESKSVFDRLIAAFHPSAGFTRLP